MKQLIKKLMKPRNPISDVEHTVRVYPSQRSCVKANMSQVRPEQMPPLMVRKAAWRR
jgi:hypothetical protein